MSSTKEAQILRKLKEWMEQQGEVPSLVDLYCELLSIQLKAKRELITSRPDLISSVISQASINERLAKGLPILSFTDLPLDWEQIRTVFQEVVVALAKHSPDLAKEIESLKNMATDISLLRRAVEACYQGSSLASIAQVSSVDTDMLSFAVHATLKVFLSLQSEVLQPKVNQESWRHRYCPICGGKPDLAYLDKERGARWLLCSRCEAEWLFLRLECPYCGTSNQDDLAYFADDEGLYRLYVCERCHTYLKAIDLRHTEAEVLLPLERVMTLDMDKQGQDKGYNPGHAKISNSSTTEFKGSIRVDE